MVKFRETIILLVTFIMLLFMIIPLPAHAQYTYFMDEFSVTKNGNLMFFDSFDDGNPPPDAPDFENGNPAEYIMAGTMGPESGGKLALDSSGVVPRVSPLGEPVLFQGAILQTNIDPNDLTRGLKSDDTFSVTGIFDLAAPSIPESGYGVRFIDIGPDQAVYLKVQRNQSNDYSIRYLYLDWVLGARTIVDESTLDLSHDQIALTLMRGDLSTNAIAASYAYIDGGIMGPVQTFTNTANIFEGENFTRAQFAAVTIVPEPVSSTLFIVGGATLGFRQWRKKRRTV